MKLTDNFYLSEFEVSQTAARLGLDNSIPKSLLSNVKRLAVLLEQVRSLINAPVIISSGYRSPTVNKAVGGVKNSQHLTASAADINTPKMRPYDFAKLIEESNIEFDQLILEFGQWVHISVAPEGVKPRRECLTYIFGKPTQKGIV